MLFRSSFPMDLVSEFARLQQALDQSIGSFPPIRGALRGFPALNVGITPKSVEIYAFAPGVEASDLDVQLEKGLLSISGKRKAEELAKGSTLHVDERFAGEFRRSVALPDDVDPGAVSAQYRDGVLHISVARREEAQPRRITIQ